MPHKPAPIFTRPIETPAICDVCGKARSTRLHQKCSRIRQKKWGVTTNENTLPLPQLPSAQEAAQAPA